MGDLTIELMQQCLGYQYGCSSEKWSSQGGCWPFRKTGECKHMCTWHELVGDPIQTTKQRDNLICPKCGGDTEWVRVGV